MPSGPKCRSPPLCPPLQEGEDDLLARGVDPRRVGVGHGEPRDARAVREAIALRVLRPQGVADEAVAVLRELRVEHQAVELARPPSRRAAGRRVLISLRRSKKSSAFASGLFANEYSTPACSPTKSRSVPGQRAMSSGWLNFTFGNDPHRLERRRRVGRADDLRGRPRRSFRRGLRFRFPVLCRRS